MQSGLYVALSGQVALQKRIETLANNIANASTVGFRAEHTKFESFLSDAASESVAFSSTGDTYIKRDSGALTRTDNPLDIAVRGDAWFAIQTPTGTVYTRDGRMQMTVQGDLQSINGYPILDVGGAPIVVNPNAGPLQIAADGMITQANQPIGAVGLFTIDGDAKLTRFENSGVIPDKPAAAALDFGRVGVVQGYVEGANVNPISEMTQLIMVSRSFDAVSGSIDQGHDSLAEAIKALGPSS
jgi:flagellar basal-body rod protein FlgF